MAATLLLDPDNWDLVLDINSNIAVATEPYALAQDAASQIKTFLGEVYWDTTIGVPWLQQILGKTLPVALLKQELQNAALRVPGVLSAQAFLTAMDDRRVAGQVQIASTTGETATAEFVAVSPQGVG